MQRKSRYARRGHRGVPLLHLQTKHKQMFQKLLGVLAGGGDEGPMARQHVSWQHHKGVALKGVVTPRQRRSGECCHRRIRGARERGLQTKANGGERWETSAISGMASAAAAAPLLSLLNSDQVPGKENC